MLYAIFQSYALLTLNYLCACINGNTACKHTVAPESNKKRIQIIENIRMFNMTRMMQSMVWLLECYRFNALLILLTLILHERFSTVFGITVNPLDSLLPSSTSDSGEFFGLSDKPHEFASEVYDLNNIDYSQIGNGFNKFTGSQEVVSIAVILRNLVSFARNRFNQIDNPLSMIIHFSDFLNKKHFFRYQF